MHGKILAADATGGIVTGDDGKRYRFTADMLRNGPARPAQEVDFEPDGVEAREIYILHSPVTRMGAALGRKRDWVAFYFSPSGRISRREFWLLGILPIMAMSFILLFIPIIGWMLELAAQWSLIAVNFKRFQDRGYPGWWCLVGLAPMIAGYGFLAASFFGPAGNSHLTTGSTLLTLAMVISLAQLALVYLRKGTPGPNAYGPDPLL